MPFEQIQQAPRKVAVIGGGISGLGAAYMLSGTHYVTLFEAEPRLGGHARTIVAGKRGDQPVDTGFIVFNHVNYPHLVQLFEQLGVPTTESNMSFGVSMNGGRFEYALNGLDSILAQRMNAVNPRFLKMLRDIVRFNAEAANAAKPGMTIRDLLAELRLGAWFRDRYLLPFSGAIWSTPTKGILDFPADAMIAFFKNHALMSYDGQHQWHTVLGGSREYVSRLERSLRAKGTEIRTRAPIQAVRRDVLGAQVKPFGSAWERFDDVVFATHSDDTLGMLADATTVERSALSSVKYQPNRATLHADTNVMPKRRKCWASWVYTEDRDPRSNGIGLSYWMNSLQPVPRDDPMFVTLNGAREIRDELIYDETNFRHPVYNAEALAAQGVIRAINGANSTWFCGAWMKNGFHEDGLASAVDVVEAMAKRDSAPIAVAAE